MFGRCPVISLHETHTINKKKTISKQTFKPLKDNVIFSERCDELKTIQNDESYCPLRSCEKSTEGNQLNDVICSIDVYCA